MSDYRRAALVLHGLHKKDRKWLLSQLREEDRTELEVLLAELTSLGIPADSLPLDMVWPGGTIERSAFDEKALKTAIHSLYQREAAMVARRLSQEPDIVGAVVASVAPATWAEGFLMNVPSERRDSIKSALSSKGTLVPKPVEEALLNAVEAEMTSFDLDASSGVELPRPNSRRSLWRRFLWRE